MQTVSAALQAELDKGREEPRVLLDLYEFYDSDAVPGPDGFDPSNAVEKFAGQEITYNGVAYRREVVSRGDISKNMGEKTNSVSLTFSNISRYVATWAQTQSIEGTICVIRCVCPTVTDDSLVLFVGRADKPSDINDKTFTLSCRQDFGNIQSVLPPRKFAADDPEGRLPSDPLYEGIRFIATTTFLTYPVVVPSTSFFGRLFGRRDTISATVQSSSMDGTPYGEVIPEVFGRCQMRLIPFLWKDHGLHVGFFMAICSGPISGAVNLRVRTPGWSELFNSFEVPRDPPDVHLGLAGTANGVPRNFPNAGYFSHLAYLSANSEGSTFEQIDNPPEVTAVVRGRVIPLPDVNGDYVEEGWTDNPVHISRFILTDPAFVNINPAFMEDAINLLTAKHCDFPLVDEINDQLVVVPSGDLAQGGDKISRYQSTGIYNPAFFLYNNFGGATPSELVDVFDDDDIGVGGGIIDWDPEDPLPTFTTREVLRKRYTINCPITAEIRAVDFLHKIIFPAAKLFMRVNKRGKYELRSEQPSDATRIRSVTSVGVTTLPIYNVLPWKTGPDLLTGRLLTGFGLTTSEVRNVTLAEYSTSGNSVALSVSKTGAVTISASGGTLSGGSASAPATGTITIGGTPGVGDTVTATIDGIPITYTIGNSETTGTVAAMLNGFINANQRLNKFILAAWSDASPTLITLTCLHGTLTLDSALLKAHSGPIPDPSAAPAIAASGSGTLAAGTYKVAYSDVGSIGSTYLTPTASVVLTANQKIDVSSLPAFPAGITSRNFFMSEEPNSTRLRFIETRTNTSNFSINALPENGAAIPPSYNTTSEELIRIAKALSTNSQDVIAAWRPNESVPTAELRLPTAPNGHKYEATAGGVTSGTEPTWPTTPGGTVVNGTVTFTEIGSTVLQQTGLTRANVITDSFKWPLGSRQSSINQIKGNFRDAPNDFALTPFRVNDRTHQLQVKKTYPLEMDLSAVDNQHQMLRIANWALAKHREGDWFVSCGTGPDGLPLEEGDIITVSDDSGGLINIPVRIEDLRITAEHNVFINQARKYSTNMFSDDVSAQVIPLPSTLAFVDTLDSHVEFIDTPPIKDEHGQMPGFYVAVSRPLNTPGNWRGWTLYVDFGDDYTELAEGDLAALIGTTTTTLGSVTDTSAYDTVNSVTFTVSHGVRTTLLTSATQAELIANPNRNLFLVGNEYVQAATITDNGSDSYTLSNLYRGRFDTGIKVVHQASERVVYMDGSEVLVPMDGSRANIEYSYKPVTTNQDVDDATAVLFTWKGGTYRPPAPFQITVYRDTYSAGEPTSGQVQIVIPSRLRQASKLLKYVVDVASATPTGTFTVDPVTNTFSATAHGLTTAEPFIPSTTGVLPAPLRKEEHYFPRDITDNTFKVSRIPNGAVLNITDIGSGTHSFSRRLRQMPVITGMLNPVVVDNDTSTVTTPGSGGWSQTIKSAYDQGNVFIDTVSSPAPNLRVFGQITESGFVAEFEISSIAKEVAPQNFYVSLANPVNAPGSTNAYYQMHFNLVTSLGIKFTSAARRWSLTIKESATGASPSTVFTDPDYEMPGTKYSIQISGSEVRYYRNYSGPGTVPIYISPISVQFPMSLDSSVTVKARFFNVITGGRPELVTTYSRAQQIKDSTSPPPATFRFRAYEERSFEGITYLGDVTDFTT